MPSYERCQPNSDGFLRAEFPFRGFPTPTVTVGPYRHHIGEENQLSENGIREAIVYTFCHNTWMGFTRMFFIPKRAINFWDCDEADQATLTFWEDCGDFVEDIEPGPWILLELIELRQDYRGKGHGRELFQMVLGYACLNRAKSLLFKPSPLEWRVCPRGSGRLPHEFKKDLQRITSIYDHLFQDQIKPCKGGYFSVPVAAINQPFLSTVG